MAWWNWFIFKVTRPCNRWPKADSFRVRVLVPVELADSECERERYPIKAGTIFSLTKGTNPFGYADSWFLIGSAKLIGASQSWWRELIESGKAEVLS